MKTPDWNNLKHGIVVLNSLSKSLILGFKKSRARVRVRVVACWSKLCRNVVGVTEYNSLSKIHPTYIMCHQMKTGNCISMTLHTMVGP